MSGRNFAAVAAFDDERSLSPGPMDKIDQQLAAMGLAPPRREPACWRAVRIRRHPAGVATSDPSQEPARSLALLRWRDRLRRGGGPSPYRISRAG